MSGHRLIGVIGVAVPALAVTITTLAQASSHEWSRRFGSSGVDEGVDIAVDATGNTVAFGEFRGTLVLGGTALVSAGERDLVVTKLDADGNYLWSRRFGSTASERAGGLAVDTDGAIYVTGAFQSAVDFGGGALLPAGQDDIYLVKLDAGGSHVWSLSFGDAGRDLGLDVAIDGDAYLYLTGTFGGTLDLGGGPLSSAGGLDMFVAKFKTSGAFQWSHAYGDGGTDVGVGVVVDGAHDVIATGEFEGTVDFGGPPVSSSGLTDVCLVELTGVGAHVWSRAVGGTKTDVAGGVAVDPSGFVVVTGSFESSADFGGGALSSHGDTDIFLARYDTNGIHDWSQSFGGPDADVGTAVAVNPDKEIHVTGYGGDGVDFGGGVLTTAGVTDIFLAKFENGGAHLWSHAFGGVTEEYGTSLAVDAAGTVFTTGSFRSRPADFGGDLIYSRGTLDIFLASYDATGVHRWSDGAGSLGFESGNDAASDADGNVFVTGVFCGSVGFGGDVLISSGTRDIFLAKYDPSGNHLWSQSFASSVPAPGPGEIPADEARGLAVDTDGNVVITGWFEGTVDFGGGPRTAVDARDIYLAEFDGAGHHLWSRSFGGPQGDRGYGVAVDGSGNVCLIGSIHSAVDFGGGPLAITGAVDGFVAVFDPYGTHLWSGAASSTGLSAAHAVAMDAAGNVTVAGVFETSVDLGGGEILGFGDQDLFVSHYTSDGEYVWSRGFGSVERDEIGAIAVDAAGNTIVTGNFRGAADFGGGVLTSDGSRDVFLAMYDPVGAHLWSQRFGDVGWESGRSLDTDAAGRILLAGSFTRTIDFGGGELGSVSGDDIFLAEFDTHGHHLWSESFGGYGQDFVESAVLVDPTTIVLTGRYYDSVDFGGGALTSVGGSDMFLAQLGHEIVGIDDAAIGHDRIVGAAHPNPFQARTAVRLDLSSARKVTVTIVDVSGRRVCTLADHVLSAGRHEITWDGRDGRGRAVVPGVYAVRVHEGSTTSTRKVVRIDTR